MDADESFAPGVGGKKARFSGLTLPLEPAARPKTAARNRLREDIDDAPTCLPPPAALFAGAGHPSCRVSVRGESREGHLYISLYRGRRALFLSKSRAR